MIFDCFTFAGEWLALEMRMRELDGLVDRFVLVEAPLTYRGEPKPLHYALGRSRLGAATDKIVHVVVRDMPTGDDHWERERHQRSAILRGLSEAAPNDLVLISDVDEIPRRDVVLRLAQTLTSPMSLAQRMYYFQFNLQVPIRWTRAKVARRRDVGDPQTLRLASDLPVVDDAGWHFSYLGDEDAVRTKLKSFAHAEYDRPHFSHPAHVERCRSLAVDLFGRYVLEVVDPASLLPVAVLADPSRFGEYLRSPRTRLESVSAHVYMRLTRYSRLYGASLLGPHPVLLLLVLSPVLALVGLRDLVRPRPPAQLDEGEPAGFDAPARNIRAGSRRA